jgi:hypothetical protein
MRSAGKADFPPLLAPGLHFMTLLALRALCVTSFTLSNSRLPIMDGLEIVLAELNKVSVVGDLWINGSFITEKIDPSDVDIVLFIDYNGMPSPTREQLDMLNWFANDDLRTPYWCDSYVAIEYPRGHSSFSLGQNQRDYWAKWFGTNRKDELTGIAVIELRRNP